ncbi:MAG: response regulator [Candidatus Omnitrophota bacterium]
MAKKILIVEDSQMVLEIIGDVLREAKFEVFMTKSGVESVDIAKEHKPDLILLDLILPDLDGFGCLASYKNDAATKDIPIIMLTAQDSQETVRRCMELGAIGCFIKHRTPPKELIAKIKPILGIS